MPLITEIKVCRVCKHKDLELVLDLGQSEISSYFPLIHESDPPKAPLVLTECMNCGLVQLKHNVDIGFLFGNVYGYRTGLNPSMQLHVESLADWLCETFDIPSSGKILDIGSNDGTFLNRLCGGDFRLYGVDPNYEDMKHHYNPRIIGEKAFFDSRLFSGIKFDLITSIAMFYDVDDPVDFARQIASILNKNGMWYLEQSYLPDMLRNKSFDTICHEHLLYFSLESISNIMESVGLKVVAYKKSRANGGSLGVVVTHFDSEIQADKEIQDLLTKEIAEKKDLMLSFKTEVFQLKTQINQLISRIREDGESIWCVGASTKGNTILSFLGLDATTIGAIADKNPLKLGRVTPGTRIPIVSAEELFKMKPNYALVLPWHFRDFIVRDEQKYLSSGGKLIFPLPNLEIVSIDDLME